jgi:hypothetical protein
MSAPTGYRQGALDRLARRLDAVAHLDPHRDKILSLSWLERALVAVRDLPEAASRGRASDKPHSTGSPYAMTTVALLNGRHVPTPRVAAAIVLISVSPPCLLSQDPAAARMSPDTSRVTKADCVEHSDRTAHRS